MNKPLDRSDIIGYHPFGICYEDGELRDWLTVKEVEALCGVSARFLYNRRKYGGGPAFYVLGRGIQYDSDDVRLWIEARRRN